MQLAYWLQLYRLAAALITTCLVLLGSPASASGKLSFSHVLPEETETLGHVNGITMDPAGYMWFGGVTGLGRYDGYSLRIFRHDPLDATTIASNAINDLIIDSRGQLWVATERGISVFDARTESFTSYRAVGSDSDTTLADSTRRLLEGPGGQLWAATANGLLRFDPASQRFAAVDIGTPAGVDGGLWDMQFDKGGRLWLATRAQGLLRFDPADGAVRRFAVDATAPDAVRSEDVRAVHVDAANRIWFGGYSGYLQSVEPDGSLLDYALPEGDRREAIWVITSDRQGTVWVGDGVGINRLKPGQRAMERYAHSEFEPASPGNFVVTSIFEDRLGHLWFGYFPSGIDRLDTQAASFQNRRHLIHDHNTITGGGVLAGLEDDNGDFWVGTGFGLNHIDRRSGKVTRYGAVEGDPTTLSGSTALSLCLDRAGQLWVGAWSKGLNRLDPATGRVLGQYRTEPGNPRSLLGMEPWRIIQDSRGDIWVATELGINRYDSRTDDFTRFLPEPGLLGGDTDIYVRDLIEFTPGKLLIGTTRGLLLLDADTGRYQRWRHRPDDASSLSADFVKSLLRDSRGRIWVGTHGGGLNLFNPFKQNFTRFGALEGLPDPVVTSMVEDAEGQLWLTTLHGISRFNPDTYTFNNYNHTHGLLGNVYNRNTAFMTAAGELFFGSSKGYSLVNTEELRANTVPPPVVLTELKIFNQAQQPGRDNSVLQQSIGATEALTLRHDQSMLAISFAALNFRLPEQNRYTYMLEGFDQNWLPASANRTATYTNLDPGHYTFKVRAANNDGVWNETARVLSITVLPPLWATGWAYAGYFLMVLGVAASIWQGIFKHLQLKQQQTLNSRLQRLDKIKDTFLANTSHELRTPLNGMIGLADAMLHGAAGPLGSDAMQKLALISQSGKRLSTLVNDILDYAKLSEAQLNISRAPVNLPQLVAEVVQLLQPLAYGKGLALNNWVPESAPWVMGDVNRLQQVLVNLIGNAIKYTEHGEVTLTLAEGDDFVAISVADTGVGIPESERANIFSPFCQLDAGSVYSHSGTGLGLAISRQLIELHRGAIAVEANGEQGSVFRVTLPRAAAGAVESAVRQPLGALSRGGWPLPRPAAPIVAHALTSSPLMAAPEQYTVLVVDDDPVNRMVLSGMLKLHRYNIIELDSAQEALKLLHSGEPIDLVILDVMMPYLNGFEVCRRLRVRWDRRQLPIMLLTAKRSDADLERGYEAGANCFLAKPISRYELLPQVANLLELRELTPAAVRAAQA